MLSKTVVRLLDLFVFYDYGQRLGEPEGENKEERESGIECKQKQTLLPHIFPQRAHQRLKQEKLIPQKGNGFNYRAILPPKYRK